MYIRKFNVGNKIKIIPFVKNCPSNIKEQLLSYNTLLLYISFLMSNIKPMSIYELNLTNVIVAIKWCTFHFTLERWQCQWGSKNCKYVNDLFIFYWTFSFLKLNYYLKNNVPLARLINMIIHHCFYISWGCSFKRGS